MPVTLGNALSEPNIEGYHLRMATFTLIKQDRNFSHLFSKSAQYLLGTALFALFLLAPAFNSQAHAATEVTQTVTVYLPDGSPAQNVKVALYLNDNGNPANSHFAVDSVSSLSTVLTDSSGHVSITAVVDDTISSLVIQPSSQYAIQTLWVAAITESHEIFLQNSTAVFKIGHRKNNPSDPFVAAEPGAAIQWPGMDNPQFSRVIDASNFGLDFGASVSAPSEIRIWPRTFMSSINESPSRFNVETNTAGYPTINQGAITAQAGVFEVNFATPNLTGTLKRADGFQLNLPTGVSYFVRFIGFTNGNLDGNAGLGQPDGYVDPVTGNWGVGMITNGATHVLLEFISQGSLNDFPTFIADPATGSIWVNDSIPAQFSKDNSAFSNPLNGVVTNIPGSANIGFTMVAPASSPVSGTPVGGYFELYSVSQADQSETYINAFDTTAGVASLILPEGMFHFIFHPNNPEYVTTNFMAVVQPSGVMVGTSLQNIFTPESDGRYTIVLLEPNLTIQIINPLTSLPLDPPGGAFIDICVQQGQSCNFYSTLFASGSGTFSAGLPAGSYQLTLTPYGQGLSGLISATFAATVDQFGVVTITSVDGVTSYSANPSFKLSLARTNLNVQIVNPADHNQPLTGGSTSITIIDESMKPKGQSGGAYVPANQNGFAGANIVTAGNYRMLVESDQGVFTTNTYTFTVDGAGQITFTGANAPELVDGIYKVWPLQPNVLLRIVSPTDTSVGLMGEGIGLNACPRPNYGIGCVFGSTVLPDGSTGISMTDSGNYDLYVYGGMEPSQTVSVYPFTFDAGVITFTGTNAPQKDGQNRYVVSPALVNLRVQVTEPGTTNAISGQTGGAYAHYCPAAGNGGDCKGFGVDDFGIAKFGISDGDYILHVGVNTQAPGSDYTENTYTFSVASGVVTFTGSKIPTKDISGTYLVSPALPNLKVQIYVPGSITPISSDNGGNIFYCPVGGGNCYGTWLDSLGQGGMSVPNGSYELHVRVEKVFQNVTYAEKIYPFTVSNNVVTFTGSEIPVKDGNRYTVYPKAANFTVLLKNPANEALLTQTWIDACIDLGNGNSGNCFGQGVNNLGYASLSLPDGNYFVRVNPGNNAGVSLKIYSVSVSGGVVTVTGVTPSSGVWTLYGALPTISGSFVTSPGVPLVFANNQGISVNLQKKVGDTWNWVNQGFWRNSNSWALNLTPDPTEAGEVSYRVVANPQGFTGLAQSYSDPIYLSANGKVSLTPNDPSPTSTLTNLAIVMRSSNLKLFILNPLSPSNAAMQFGWVQIDKVGIDRTDWYVNADLNPNANGSTGAVLEDGSYVLTVYPPQGVNSITGLAAKRYTATVSGSGSVVRVYSGDQEIVAQSGIFTLSPASANISAVVLDSLGNPAASTNSVWVWASLQKWSDLYNNWMGLPSSSQTNASGAISLYVSDPGRYRLRIDPNGLAESTLTYSPEFTIASDGSFTDLSAGATVSNGKLNLQTITLNSPSIKVKVTAASGGNALTGIGIEVRRNGQWIDWANVSDSSKIAAISLPDAGTYQLIVNPPWNGSQPTATKTTYTVIATKSGDIVTGTIDSAPIDGSSSYVLKLGEAAIKGVVKAPGSSSTVIANSYVVAINVTTGMEMWEYGANTNSSGIFAMSLPAGQYKLQARAPWGASDYGNSNYLGTFTVGTDGAITSSPEGVTDPRDLTIRLNAPTWKGTLVAPDGLTPISFGSICFTMSQTTSWSCVTTDIAGNWALSAPSDRIVGGVVNFNSEVDVAILDVRQNSNALYSPRRYQEPNAVKNLLGTTACVNPANPADAACHITIALLAPNVSVLVTAGGVPVANAWVNLDRDGIGWLGGSNTDSLGIARINVDHPELAMNARVELNNTTVANSYTSTFTKLGTGALVADVRSITVPLKQPNLRGQLTEKTASGWVAVPYAWVEIVNTTKNQWVGGASTDANGNFLLNIEGEGTGSTPQTFTLGVNPPWNGTSTNSRQVYDVVVSEADAVPVISLNGVEITDAIKALKLAEPNVIGVVVRASDQSTVANSQIVAIDTATNQYYWDKSVNSRSTGAFSMSLPVGATYWLEAGVPWGNSTLAKSARCTIHIALDGSIDTPTGGCVQAAVGGGVTINLGLRAPNLTFTLVRPGLIPTAVANANIGVGFGSWNTWTQSGSDGKVSLFIDSDAIALANGGTFPGEGYKLHLWVDPPWGDSSIVRWECNAGDVGRCADIANPTSLGFEQTTPLTTIQFAAPNTRIKVVLPDGTTSAGQGAWVSIFDTNHMWLGGSVTDTSGYASFDINTSLDLVIEVNPPYNTRSSYSSRVYGTYNNGVTAGVGIPKADVASSIALGDTLAYALNEPNLVLTVKNSDSGNNKWGWVGIETCSNIDGGGICTQYNWLGGYGLDDKAQISLTLPAAATGLSARYRVTAYPGGGQHGARTECIVETDDQGNITLTDCLAASGKTVLGTKTTMTLTLTQGNVTGYVHDSSGAALAGAVVYANLDVAGVMSTDDSTAVITSTTANGGFGLQLDPTKTWRIRILPITRSNLATYDSPSTLRFDGGAANLLVITLETK